MAIERRFFVVGVPRSGTTLVQSLLAAQESLTSFTESHFFSRHFKLFGSFPVLTKNPRPRLLEFLKENEEAAEVSNFLPLLARPATQKYIDLLDHLTLRRGKTGWIEKTPKHLRYIPFLQKTADVRCVHVIRDGLETVASLSKASQNWERPYDLKECVRRWNEDVAFSLDRVGVDHFVVYEQLADDPERVMNRLFRDLGIDPPQDLLARASGVADRLKTAEESWKDDVGREIRPSATSEQVLSAEERDWVRGALRRELYEQIIQRTER